nr:hypothetical protein [Akkermansiaceae bacterium]
MPPPALIRRPALLALLVVMASPCHAGLVNLAGRGTATQTSEWNGGQFPAALAIDGDPATFSHTDGPTPNNAWSLRLDAEYGVARVEIAMRADCCGGRLTGATLRLFDGEGDSVFDRPITDPGPGRVVVFEIPGGIATHSLRIGFENGATNPSGNTAYVHLAEVRVLAEIDLLPVVTTFRATTSEIGAGQSSQLSWDIEGATSVELVGVGPVEPSGTIPVSPPSSGVYTIVASNRHGSRSRSLAIIVDGRLLPPRLTEFMADNAGTIVRSDGSTPDWIELWNP